MLYLGLSVKPQKRLIGVFFRGQTGWKRGLSRPQTADHRPQEEGGRKKSGNSLELEREYLARCLANGLIKDLIVVG